MLNISDLAQVYLDTPDQLDSLPQAVRSAFRAWVVERCHSFLPSHGLRMTIAHPGAWSPSNYRDLCNHAQDFSEILVSSDNNNSDLLPGEYNLWFRAWHDATHYAFSQEFTFAGEAVVACIQAQQTGSRLFQKILFSEVVLHAAVYFHTGDFAPGQQKLVLVDDSTLDAFLAAYDFRSVVW